MRYILIIFWWRRQTARGNASAITRCSGQKRRGYIHDGKTEKTPSQKGNQKKKYAEKGIQNDPDRITDRSGRNLGNSIHPALQAEPDGRRHRGAVHSDRREHSCNALGKGQLKRGEKTMTDKQKKTAYAMIVDGFSLHEIAEATRTSEKEIKKEFKFALPKEPAKPRVHRTPGVYPNLERWMRENRFTQAMMGNELGVTAGNFNHICRGKQDIPKRYIDKILELTGMTYEECFAKEKAPEEAATSIKG